MPVMIEKLRNLRKEIGNMRNNQIEIITIFLKNPLDIFNNRLELPEERVRRLEGKF